MAGRVLTALGAVLRQRGFMLRWVTAVTLSVSLVSIVQYVVSSRELENTMLEHATHDFENHVDQLETDLQERVSPGERLSLITMAVDGITERQEGVVYVGVFDARGVEVFATDPGSESLGAGDLAAVTGGEAVARKDSDATELAQVSRYVYLIPVPTPQGALVVKIEQSSGVIGELLGDLRGRLLLGLLANIVLVVPLSYLLGGRTLRRRQAEAQDLAGRDELTGILGRRPFRPLLSAALADPTNTSVSLALIDIDHFKGVNDRLGHSYGDRVLVALGQAFEELRASDRAFRLGGDEFAVVLLDTSDRETAEVIERVRASFSKRMPGITVSCGVASVQRQDAVPLQELWERTDSALYQAKKHGRARTVAFSSLTLGVTVAADKLDAVQALCDDEVECTMAFQPIWDLRAGCILGHEALLRLPAGLPLDGPAEAFELADRIGRAAELDALGRRSVLRVLTAKPWPGGLLFVNVHPVALREFDFDAFAADLIAVGVPHTDVVLEVTEHADLDNPTNVRALKRARARGFKLALDDLGAGNAGLRALTHTQFDVIKLDRRVISRLGIDPAADAVVAAATAFVRNTGGWVIAEGIEDRFKLDAVLDDSTWRSTNPAMLAGQGYLLGYPATDPQALEARLDLLEHAAAVD